MGPYQRTPKYVAIELLDTQVFSGSVQWVLLEISLIYHKFKPNGGKYSSPMEHLGYINTTNQGFRCHPNGLIEFYGLAKAIPVIKHGAGFALPALCVKGQGGREIGQGFWKGRMYPWDSIRDN